MDVIEKVTITGFFFLWPAKSLGPIAPRTIGERIHLNNLISSSKTYHKIGNRNIGGQPEGVTS